MVATTRSRSSPSLSRALRPRLSKPADEGEHSKAPTTRPAFIAVSVKKGKDDEISDTKRRTRTSSAVDDEGELAEARITRPAFASVSVKKEKVEQVLDTRRRIRSSSAVVDEGELAEGRITRPAFASVSVKKEKDEQVLDTRRRTRRSSAVDDVPVKKEIFALEENGVGQLRMVCCRDGEKKGKILVESFSPLPIADCHYESLRLQRIAENKARLAALGVQEHAETLTSFFRASKPAKRTTTKSPATPIEFRRRSDRLKNTSPSPGLYTPSFDDSDLETSEDSIEKSAKRRLVWKGRSYRNYHDEETPRPANAPLPKNCPAKLEVSPILTALRCRSKERGTLYDSIVGICCHFCRQKKLCGEEDCERCGQRDVTKTCLGKTDCSRCHSNMGVFCRACLKIRYGEELEEVRQKTDWLCPHCSEEQGLNPYWICNSSICLSRRKIAPTGIAIYKARELGFKSVAHYLADLLEKGARI